MSRVFAVCSGKGGVGKSTFSVGLALSFCRMDKRVLLVDMDEGLRCLDLMLGVDKDTVTDLSDILIGRDIEDAVYSTELSENLYLIPAPLKAGMIDSFAFSSFCNDILPLYDIIIFDFPAGMDFRLYPCLSKNTLFITVAVDDPVCIRDAAAVCSQLDSLGLESRLVINRFVYKQSVKYKVKNIDEIIDNTGLQLLGIVPYSDELALFSLKRKLSKKGKPAAAFKRIARRLLGEHVLLGNLKKI